MSVSRQQQDSDVSRQGQDPLPPLLRKHSIPRTWTGEQALLVTDFLEQLSSAIWDIYEAKMMPIILANAEDLEPPTNPANDDTGDLPF